MDSIGCSGESERKVYRVHQHDKCWELVRSKDGARHYIVKYATKPNQRQIPKGFTDIGRWWGASRNVKPGPVLRRVEVTEHELRRVLRSAGHPAAQYGVMPGILFGLDIAIGKAQSIDELIAQESQESAIA